MRGDARFGSVNPILWLKCSAVQKGLGPWTERMCTKSPMSRAIGSLRSTYPMAAGREVPHCKQGAVTVVAKSS